MGVSIGIETHRCFHRSMIYSRPSPFFSIQPCLGHSRHLRPFLIHSSRSSTTTTTSDDNDHDHYHHKEHGHDKTQARRARTTFLRTLTTLPIIIVLFQFVGQVITVTGPSMAPTLSPDYTSTRQRDRVWANMWDPVSKKRLQRGSIIAFRLVILSPFFLPFPSLFLSLSSWLGKGSFILVI